MKIGVAVSSVPEVHLPVEIINNIIDHIDQRGPKEHKQHALWACSLVSKSWYSATVAHLYQSPLLRNRNFDKFSRTICPPVNSHVRRIGLESFVMHLDMGNLAYESSKSLTARLLRRTHMSLETFVAPAVSFSVACLAPLSKCHALKVLDLSRDFYDIDLDQLLHSVGNLKGLTSLSLPKSAFRKRYVLKPKAGSSSPWPPSLCYLQINDSLPTDAEKWDELIESFPHSLRAIACQDSLDYNSFWLLYHATASAEQVSSLYIGAPRREDEFPLLAVLKVFPRLVRLSVPCSVLPIIDNGEETEYGSGKHLERLDLRRDYDGLPPLSALQLQGYVAKFPKLTRIDLLESSLQMDDEQNLTELEILEAMIEKRAGRGSRWVAGIFLDGN